MPRFGSVMLAAGVVCALLIGWIGMGAMHLEANPHESTMTALMAWVSRGSTASRAEEGSAPSITSPTARCSLPEAVSTFPHPSVRPAAPGNPGVETSAAGTGRSPAVTRAPVTALPPPSLELLSICRT